jgi:membrane protease YdiL (CAAX protease family)
MIFILHASIRFGGLSNPLFIPISMMVIWPLPWLISSKDARKMMGFRGAKLWWFAAGPLVAVVVLFSTAGVTWWIFGDTDSNWFVRHALAMQESLSGVPKNSALSTKFLIVTIPAMVFSPFGEEFLFRGYLLAAFSAKLGTSASLVIQAAAFALVHLAHYGLDPFQPELILVWLPSMFLAGYTFGWITVKSGSVWCAVISHTVYNLGMNAIVFFFLQDNMGF